MQPQETLTNIATYNAFEGNSAPITDAMSRAGLRVEVAEIQADGVTLRFGDGHVAVFHPVWLRLNCFCKQCGNSGDGIRSITIMDVPADIQPASVNAEGGTLTITWPDGHLSDYATSWLRTYDSSPARREELMAYKPILWKSDMPRDFPSVDYAATLNDDRTRLEMMENLRDWGIVRIRDVGSNPDEFENLAALLGPIHETSVYGRIFDVQVEPVAKLGSKTGIHQDPHHDDAFYYAQPGIVFFHCLVNSEGKGGESTYTDGFAIAEAIRAEAPEAFELLTTVPIPHNRRHPGEIDVRVHARLIRLDWTGRISGVRYFDRAMAPLDLPHEMIGPMYEAIREFHKRMVSPEFKAEIKLSDGNAVLIDNNRCQHGRNAFVATSPRRIRTCHVDRDEFHGRMRDLGARLGKAGYDMWLPQGACPA